MTTPQFRTDLGCLYDGDRYLGASTLFDAPKIAAALNTPQGTAAYNGTPIPDVLPDGARLMFLMTAYSNDMQVWLLGDDWIDARNTSHPRAEFSCLTVIARDKPAPRCTRTVAAQLLLPGDVIEFPATHRRDAVDFPIEHTVRYPQFFRAYNKDGDARQFSLTDLVEVVEP